MGKRLLCALAYLVVSLGGLSTSQAASLHVGAGDVLTVRFGLPAVPVLYTNDGMIFALNGLTGTASSLQVSVFNGSQLLGTSSGGPEFDFAAPTALFGPATATRLDFSSFADASIDGAVQVRPSGGFFDVTDGGVALHVGGWVFPGSAIQIDSGYGAVISSISVSPVPEPTRGVLMAVGTVAVLLRSRRPEH